VALMEQHLPQEMESLRLTRSERNMLERPSKYSLSQFNALISRILVNLMVTTLTETAAYQLNRFAAEEKVEVNGLERPINYKSIQDYRLQNRPDNRRMQLIFSYSRCSCVEELAGGFRQRINDLTKAIGMKLLRSTQILKADREGQEVIAALFRAYYADPRYLPNHCVFEFLGEFHRLRQLPELAPWFRSKVRLSPEKKLREKAAQKGMGPVRSTFTRIISNRKVMLPGEELLLMRTICNHIACMTDDYALQTLRELQKNI
jgi:dGTP triphosphohydrolase